MINKIFIANRGEISRRIIRTIKKLNLKSVAGYCLADLKSQFVAEADESILLDSIDQLAYLNPKRMVAAAKLTSCDAVIPGYGFLSESSEFAELVRQNNIAFIGPSTDAIRIMGDKIAAKEIAIKSGVPVVKGKTTDPLSIVEVVHEIGLPVIIKASFGGGGRGMRIIREVSGLVDACKSASDEAMAGFGSGSVFVEKLMENARHIEVQIIGDRHGNIMILGDRDCSIQRRHQKIIEECPAPNISEETRKRLYEYSLKLGHAINYYSVGTVEFLFNTETNEIFFIEMNTRLQVEHTITEMHQNLDLVELMIEVESGNKLCLPTFPEQKNVHCFEARIYSEDPSRSFSPTTGAILSYEEPIDPDIRIDSGIQCGSVVYPFYDSMLIKLCTKGITRKHAINKMQEALALLIVKGSSIKTNQEFIQSIFNHDRFCNSEFNTNFISEEYDSRGELIGIQTKNKIELLLPQICGICFSISSKINNFSSGVFCHVSFFNIKIDVIPHISNITEIKAGLWKIGDKYFINVKIINPWSFELLAIGAKIYVEIFENHLKNLIKIATQNRRPKQKKSSSIKSQIGGIIKKIFKQKGDKVENGETIMIIEAMKMQNLILAESSGVVTDIFVREGDFVDIGREIVSIKELRQNINSAD